MKSDSRCSLRKMYVFLKRYEAGDHVAVYPVNESEIVEGIGKRLEIDVDTVFTLTNLDGEVSPLDCMYKYS